MSDSDEESNHGGNSSSEEESGPQSGMNMTGFLFGNIDREGKLEEDFLDETSRKKLNGLSSLLGLKSIIEEEAKNAGGSAATDDYEDGVKVCCCCNMSRVVK